MKKIFSAIFICASFLCYAQDSTEKILTVHISPVLVNVPSVELGFQFGLQYHIRNWSFGAELAFPFQKSNDHYIDMQYRRWGAEIKNFLGKEKQNYLSLQFNYAQRNFRDSSPGRFFRKAVYDAYDYRSASISSPILNTTFKVGREMRLGKKFFVDGFVGLGVGVVTTEYKNIEGFEPVDRISFIEHFGIYSAHRYDKTKTRIHIAAGARLHYRFK